MLLLVACAVDVVVCMNGFRLCRLVVVCVVYDVLCCPAWQAGSSSHIACGIVCLNAGGGGSLDSCNLYESLKGLIEIRLRGWILLQQYANPS